MTKKLNTSNAAARFARLADAVEREQKAVERTEIIPVDSIVINQDNIFSSNDTEESIAELAKNIAENGLLHNIVVAETEPGKYLLISGERRTRAVKYLGRDKIKATIRSDLSELEILKMLFFANSETREYTTEEKIYIIGEFQEKLRHFDDTSEKEAVKKFREYVAQAFNINERQASKLISINSELTEPLKKLLYTDAIDINTAAALAQLPAEYQSYAADIIKRCDVDTALVFTKQAKSIISRINSVLVKNRTARIYHSRRLEKAREELSVIANDTEEKNSPEELAEFIRQKLCAEKSIEKYKVTISQLDEAIQLETQKQHDEVKALYENIISSTGKKADEEETDAVLSRKIISKEVRAADNAIKRLLDISPSEELKEIQRLLEKYKDSLE
ncbi:MAG: ParB N-terminal domain-containing protein [Ruminococcus sp.]|nr:ParB N-terminal domain-containing protein [Ruminococcus sp.]